MKRYFRLILGIALIISGGFYFNSYYVPTVTANCSYVEDFSKLENVMVIVMWW